MTTHYEIRGEGEPLLLLHGFTGTGADWRHVFKEPPAGFKLAIPDLRGHGRSASVDGMNFTPPYLATIAARTLIVHVNRDPLYPVDIAVEMYSPRSYPWNVPNGGHGPIFGDRSNQFRETALAFVRDHP